VENRRLRQHGFESGGHRSRSLSKGERRGGRRGRV
jgi:hypothetical protein